MPEEQAQGQQTVETVERVEKMQERQEQEPEKKAVRRVKATPEQVFRPSASRSYWPFALALILSISLMGVITYPIIFFIGMLLTIVIIIAWSIERK